MMNNYKSFSAYVESTFYNELFKAANKYVILHQDSLPLNLNMVINPGRIELDDIHVQYTWVHSSGTMDLTFDVELRLDVIVYERGGYTDEQDICNPYLMVNCSGSLENKLSAIHIEDVHIYAGKEPSGNRLDRSLDDSLVPVIGKKDLDKYAELFLKKYYPEALVKPVKIDPLLLASRMKLKVKEQEISKDGSVFGQTFFKDCETELYDCQSDEMKKVTIPTGTVLVDPNVAFAYNIGAFNNTVVHECVHWAFHRRAILFEQAFNENASSIKCQVVGGASGNKKSSYDWMEWQANALAPRIQMPLRTFKQKVGELYDEYRQLLKGAADIEFIEPVIIELARFYGVSRTAAKIRMVDAGYDVAMGAFNYVDGRYIPPYKTTVANILKPNQTYSISRMDAAMLGLANMNLREAGSWEIYRYIDSHIVLNDPKYIQKNPDGSETLTHFARMHMEQCCVAFNLNIQTKIQNRYHSECYLDREKNSKVKFTASVADDSKQPEGYAVVAKRKNDEIRCVLHDLHGNFQEDFKTLIKWSDMSYDDVAFESGISASQLHRYSQDEKWSKNISRDSVFRLCMAMELPYQLSVALMDSAGLSFRSSDRDLAMQDMLMYGLQKLSTDDEGDAIWERCNQFLEEMGLEPLANRAKD